MMRIIRRLCMALTVLAAFTGIGLQASAAAPVKTYTYPFQQTAVMRGIYGSGTYFFTVDKRWNVQAVTLHLVFGQSQLLDTQGLSSMTVLLNGKPVHSLALSHYGADRSAVTVTLPLTQVQTGVNTLSVQDYRRISVQACVDASSSANWLKLYGDSAVTVRYTEQEATGKLSDYPYPFFRTQQSSTLATAVTVGNSKDEQELSSALTIVSAFGRYAGTHDLSLVTVPIRSLQDRSDRDLIFIGKSRTAPAEIRTLFPPHTDFASGAWFRVTQSPYNPAHMILAVVADRDEDLKRAAQFLQNDRLVAQADTSLFHLDSGVKIQTQDEKTDDSMTFAALGYAGTYLYGPSRSTTSVSVQVPENRQVGDGARVLLHFRYAKDLDFSRSLVTVYVNDTPIGSKSLTRDAADDDTLNVALPADVRTSNYYTVKIAFDLKLPEQTCVKGQEETPWAYVINDSTVYLPTSDSKTALLSRLPSPFVKDGKWNHTAFVLPDPLTPDDLNLAGVVAIQLGASVSSNQGELRVLLGTPGKSKLSQSNLIVIGSPKRVPLIRQDNEGLFFAYDKKGTYFESNDQLELMPDKSKTLASFQMIDSPYQDGNAMLALTAPNEANLKRAVLALFRPSAISTLTGDCALIAPDGIFYQHQFKQSAVETPHFWNGGQSVGNVLIFALIALFVVVMIVLTLLLLRRKNANLKLQFEKQKHASEHAKTEEPEGQETKR